MIEAAGLGVAFHGKPAIREAAAACIDYGDLTALLYAQGYRREEFVERRTEDGRRDGRQRKTIAFSICRPRPSVA